MFLHPTAALQFGERFVDPHQVTFDGVNKLIIVNYGVETIDFDVDVYSSWKRWSQERVNAAYLPAMRSVGGDPLPGNQRLGATFFLTNGWRMRTWEGDHRLVVVGNVYTEEGDTVFVRTVWPWNIQISLSTSVETYAVEPDLTGLAQEVWAHSTRDLTGKVTLDDTTAAKIDSMVTKIGTILDIEEGNWEIVGSQMIFKDALGNEIMRFNLFNQAGNASAENVYKRTRV